MKRLDGSALAAVVAEARVAPRGRANRTLHPHLADAVQRLLNVVQPGSYVRPHRHAPGRFELFLLLEGAAAVLAFDDSGRVVDRERLAVGGTRVVEIPGGVWHTLLALAPDTVLFEVKPGPYAPETDKEFADWAPEEGAPTCDGVLRRWARSAAAP